MDIALTRDLATSMFTTQVENLRRLAPALVIYEPSSWQSLVNGSLQRTYLRLMDRCRVQGNGFSYSGEVQGILSDLASTSLLCIIRYEGNPDRDAATKKLNTYLDLMLETQRKKDHDYAGENTPFSNLVQCELAGIPAWVGVAIRIGDKVSRIINFAKQQDFQVTESLVDTLLDLAVYCMICIILYEMRSIPEISKLDK